MSTSAFGVEHGDELAKGLSWGGRRAYKTAAAGREKLKVAFKPMKAGVKPTGAGSMRGQMDPRAWESRTAAERRSGS